MAQAKTNIVITMGGNGTRFTKAGFDQPKYMIAANGRSLFLWSLLSLDAFLVNANVIFVVKKEDNADDFIASECQKAGLSDYQIMPLEQLTNGQATSAALSVDLWDDTCPLAIYNIDTFIEPFNLVPPQAQDVDGLFPCFVAEGDHWSFAKIDDNGIAVEVAEKRRISQYASIGLYWFKTTQLFLDAFKATYSQDDSLVNGEAYIAPLYKYIIDKGLRVKVDVIANNVVHPIGTPAELAVFKALPERFSFSF
ncbi:MAG: hypothetical protein HRT35_11965 [Algicola sp.]|nr:hypothetical protein [Algicola sp.]